MKTNLIKLTVVGAFFLLSIFSCSISKDLSTAIPVVEKKEKVIASSEVTTSSNTEENWKEEYAYLIGKQAYIYGYPALYYASLRYGMVENPQGLISMPINTYYHIRTPALPEHQNGGSPNRDTPYSIAFVDLSKEPIVFTAPEIPDNRYFAIQLADFYSDVFGYIGKRTTGMKKGNYLITGPNFKGAIPDGFDGTFACPTNWMFVVSRTYTDASEADLKIVHKIQDEHHLTPLSEWGKQVSNKKENRDVLNPFPPTDPLGAFKTMNAAMMENPPPARDDALMTQFAQVGLGSKGTMDLDALDESIKKGLKRAIVDGHKFLGKVAKAGGSITGNNSVINNWFYSPKNWGKCAESGDFLGRASPQAFSGIVEHYIEEAAKLRTFVDENGDPLDAKNKYVLHFTKAQIPQPKEFWSLTPYDERFNIIANPDRIFSVGSMFPNMKYNEDGSLTIYLQREKPSTDKIYNWLPTPESGTFNLFLREYIPDEAFITHTYIAPPVKKVN